MSITIHPLTPADHPLLPALHDPARRQELALAHLDAAFKPFAEAAEAEGFYGYPHLDAAWLDGTLAGFSAYTDEELAWVYVGPQFQRRGVGKALVRHALETAPGIYYIEVLSGNAPARSLYESFGFRLREVLHGRMPGNESFAVTVDALVRPEAGFCLEAAAPADLPSVYALINARLDWFKERGSPQWSGYWDYFPESYYEAACREGRLMVLRDRLTGKLSAAGVYAEADGYWADTGTENAGYLHNFVSSFGFPGAGSLFLARLEGYARQRGRARFRLDCGAQNETLQTYYKSRGYREMGRCADGGYEGIRLEKPLIP